MNKSAIGRSIFAQIKTHIQQSGGSLTPKNFPPDFPISRASCYNIRAGKWTVELLAKLPFETGVSVNYQNQNQK